METTFIKLLNMSISAVWLILAVVILRLLLKKAPKILIVIMWALVGIRLICPFSIESIFSLIPSNETISPDILYFEKPAIQSGIPALNSSINPIISETLAPNAGDSVNPIQVLTFAASIIWCVGIATMLIYCLISYIRLHNRTKVSIRQRDNIYFCDNIDSSFILGIFRPRVYLPSGTTEDHTEYIIKHEKVHLRRLDHIWKPLGFLILSIHWFNPAVWIAYVLFCRDIELSCDEAVIKALDKDSKKGYIDALVSCSVQKRAVMVCPLAFGEVGIKNRIKSVVNYKKPALWIIVTTVIACIIIAVCFLTSPITNKSIDDKLAVFIDCQIASHHQSEKSSDNFCCLDWEVLGTEKSGNETTIYMWVFYTEYSYNNVLHKETGAHIPTVLTVKNPAIGEYSYELIEYWEPRDGSYYAKDINEKFPWYLQSKALDSQSYATIQNEKCEKMAIEHFNIVLQSEAAMNTPQSDGYALFYDTATDEHQTPNIEKSAVFTPADMNRFLSLLEEQRWANDYLVDRITYSYNGCIYHDGWIFFSYDQKIIFYNHYFCTATDEILNMIKLLESRAVPYTPSSSQAFIGGVDEPENITGTTIAITDTN